MGKGLKGVFEGLRGGYVGGVVYVIDGRWVVWGSMGVWLGVLVVFVNRRKRGVIGEEDRGRVMVRMKRKGGRWMGERGKRVKGIKRGVESMGEIE